MEGVNGAGGGESGNEPPPIRRRPRAPSQPQPQPQPQGIQNSHRPTKLAHPDPRSSRPRNLALPRQPRPVQPTPVNAMEGHAHQDNGYGYGYGYGHGHESGYGNTHNHPGHVQPHLNANPNDQSHYAEENHYVYDNTAPHGQGYGVSHQREAYDGSAYDGGQGYGGVSHQGEAYDGSAHDGAHGVVGSSGVANGKGGGYGVEGNNGMSATGRGKEKAVGQEPYEPNETCMKCVHGIAVPVARVTTRAVIKGTRCIACVCTIL